jgi:molecular chaperone HscB
MTADYFAVFDLPRSFDLNLPDLEKRYFAAQRRVHPDRLVGKSAAERQQAIAQSMLVNEAYETLKDPLKRARHMLALAGMTDLAKPSQELLMEIMTLREALAETDILKDIERFDRQNEEDKRATLDALLQAFAGSDILKAAELAMRFSYLGKLADEIRIRRKAVT